MLFRSRRDGLDLASFIASIESGNTHLIQRTAVYAVANPETVPQALLHNMKHNQVLHEKNIIMTVRFDEVPWVHEQHRVKVEKISEHFWQVVVTYGFMNTPDVPKALMLCQQFGLDIPTFETTYFLSRETVVPTPGGGMACNSATSAAPHSPGSANVSPPGATCRSARAPAS